jgi:hypothetical protein
MEHEQIVALIYQRLEADDLEQAVMGCVRLARNARDYINLAIFLRELSTTQEEFSRALYNDISGLKEEAQVLLGDTAQKRWLTTHTLDFSLLPDKPDHNVLRVSAGELDSEIKQLENSISGMVVPPNMHPFDAAAFTDKINTQKASTGLLLKGCQKLKARCHNYASQMEYQLDLQKRNQGFLDIVQNEVNNFFKEHSTDVYVKLQKAAELAASKDLEDAALLLTEVRRALKAAADFFYPPVKGKVICADSQERDLGEEKYLNRLREALAKRVNDSTSKDLLEAELEALGNFLKRLNDLASKGVHASVALAEAKQGLVGLYFFLFNFSQNLWRNKEP